jgi:cytochrome c556
MIRTLARLTTAMILAALLAVGMSGMPRALAQTSKPSRAEQLIKYRQAVYTVLGGNFGPIAAMASGKAPFDARELALRAERVAFLARMLDEAFPPESREGAPTRAKPEIWSTRSEFDDLLDDMQRKTTELASVARDGELAKIKPVVNDLGEACKACHDKFRAKAR